MLSRVVTFGFLGDFCMDSEFLNKAWKEAYIEFLADPFNVKGDKDFACEHDIDYPNFRTWKSRNREAIFAEANKRANNFKNEMKMKVRKELLKRVEGDTNAMKLMLQWLGELVEKSEIKTEMMTYEDKLRRAKAILENVSKKKKAWGDESDLVPPESPRVESSGVDGAGPLPVEGPVIKQVDEPRKDI